MVSCTKESYMTYDSANNGIYFHRDTLTYSFSVTPVEQTTYTLNVPVKAMGTVSDQPRTFAYAIENALPSADVLSNIYMPATDTLGTYQWAEPGVQYTAGTGTIPAGAIEGIIPITINRSALKGTYADGYTHYRFFLRLTANDNFRPTLSEADQVRLIQFDNAVERPRWINDQGELCWIEGRYGSWHPFTLIKMVEYYHAIADILPDTYRDMVALYGPNLERMKYGSDYMYRTIFNKYICKPLYDYIQSHHDEILAMYPDYPFDFPDPYAK